MTSVSHSDVRPIVPRRLRRGSLLPATALVICIAMTTGCAERESAHAAAADSPPPAHAEAAPAAHDAAAGEDAHAAHAASDQAMPTLPATPWPSDPALREGMRRMQRAVQALEHAEHGHLDAAQSTAVAQQVQDAANYMIANCKLPAEPDAALHGLLSTLLAGAAAIKADPADTGPVASMREAIALYPRMFEDASWQSDTAAAESTVQ